MAEVERVVCVVGFDGYEGVALRDFVVSKPAFFAAEDERDVLAVGVHSRGERARVHARAVEVGRRAFLAACRDEPVRVFFGVIKAFFENGVFEHVLAVHGARDGNAAVGFRDGVDEDEFVDAEIRAGARAVAEVFFVFDFDQDHDEGHVLFGNKMF